MTALILGLSALAASSKDTPCDTSFMSVVPIFQKSVIRVDNPRLEFTHFLVAKTHLAPMLNSADWTGR